jgi:4-hydroxybenzoate polyprenyltransferase/phosphoserine phosphatase
MNESVSVESLKLNPERITPGTLVVDLDGTLTPIDTLVESCYLLLIRSPLTFFRSIFSLRFGKAIFKQTIADQVQLKYDLLPFNPDVIDYIKREKQNGRRIILATAAHHRIAEGVSATLGLFDQVIATKNGNNLRSEAKLIAIRECVGADFEYIGDSRADLPVWRCSKGALLVSPSRSLRLAAEKHVKVTKVFSGVRSKVSILRALRPHQWLKNLLIFVPLLTSFSFNDFNRLYTVCFAFLAFCLAASATYILNDLWDIESDRAHPRKKERPFASGQLSVLYGVLLAGTAFLMSLGIASIISKSFLVSLVLYLLITTAYTSVLKRVAVLDVLVLSCLYTWRVFCGAVAAGTPVSSWLLDFSLFLFLGLAVVKRCSELVVMRNIGQTHTKGRDYRITDLDVLWPIGVGASLCSIVVFGMFISASETRERYKTPEALWLVSVGLVYWLMRIWVKTGRGEMNDDPIIFAALDKISRYTIFLIIAIVLIAKFIEISTLTQLVM